MTISHIGIVGAGTMGNGIAHVCALSGYDVILTDVKQEILDKAMTVIAKNMERQVKKEIIDKDQKGLVFVGRCHDFTHYQFPKHVNFGRDIMGSLLHREFEDRVFQVWPSSGIFPIVEKVMEIKGHEPLGFDLYASPFANILTPSSWYDAPDVPLSRVARGYVYLGPRANLHSNTAIKGFVTDSMFEKHKDFYQTCFGRPFKNAAEVDRYLQEHRWPSP